MTKPKKGKQDSTQKISASIRKPSLSTSKKLDQALEFAQRNESLTSQSTTNTKPEKINKHLEVNSKPQTIYAQSLIPNSSKEQAILRERAKLIAQQDTDQDEEIYEQYIRFKLGLTELYGIPYQYAEKILPAAKVTQVPCTPPIIAGIVNYRGELLTVLDLKQIFGAKQDDNLNESWIIIVKAGTAKAGLIIDEIEDNDEFVPAKLTSPLGNNGYIQGVHAGKVVILNIGSILTDSSLQIDESVN